MMGHSALTSTHLRFLGALAALSMAAPTVPAPLPATQIVAGITARDQPIGEFVRDLMGRTGRPVVVSSGLTGTISGTFSGPVEKIFGDVSKAFGLVGYYDGAAIYVYANSELTEQSFQVGAAGASRAVRQAAGQRLGDARNVVRASGETLVANGVPRFLEQVSAIVQGSGGPIGGIRGASLPTGVGNRPPVTPLEFRVFYLRYARADDTLVSSGQREVRMPGLATILQNLVLDQRPGGSAGLTGAPTPTFGARLVRQSAPRLKGLGLDSVAPVGNQLSSLDRLPILGAPSTALEPDPGYAEGADAAVPLSTDVVRIEPNPYLNAVIVRDVPERMASYDSLIRALDVEPQLVEIEATIIDINVDKLRRLGINWRFGSGGFGALFGSGQTNDDNNSNDLRLLPTGGSRRDNVSNITPSAAGGTISTIIGSQREFLGRITALEQKGAARVVSRPQVMTLSNVEALFDRTRTFYVRVAGRAEVDLFNVTAGTVLRVNPHVFRDQGQTRIRVLVNIEDGAIDPRSVIENLPIVERSSVSTQAMVVDGESLLLGGMTVDTEAEDISKIPLLGDVPLLGNLFKNRTKQRDHMERLFLITPRMATLTSRTIPAAVAPGAALPSMPPMPAGPAASVPPAPAPATAPTAPAATAPAATVPPAGAAQP
jgi:type III secretion protein C